MSDPFTVKECLQGYTDETLRLMCDAWGLAAGTKASRIRALERVLHDTLLVRDGVNALTPPALRLLHLLVGRESTLADDILQVRGLIGPDEVNQALDATARLGLVLVRPQGGAGAFSFAHLAPDHLQAHIPPELFVIEAAAEQLPPAPPLGIAPEPVDGPAKADVAVDPEGATTAMLEVFRLVELHVPRVIAAGGIHRTDLARIQDAAREAGVSAETIRMAFMLGRELGCLDEKNGRLMTTGEAECWVEGSRAERIERLFTAFLHSEELADLEAFFPQLSTQIDDHLPHGSLRRTYHRALVAALLRELAPDTWYAVDGFIATIRRVDRNVLLLDELWRAIEENGQNSPRWKDRSWGAHEHRFVTWLLTKFMAKQGITELADEGRIFRITPTGRYVLGVGAAPEAATEAQRDALVVQPDFEIIAYLERCSPDLRRKLDTFCERVRGGVVATYRLNQESVYRGIRSGSRVDELAELLRRHSNHPLPANVADQFATWARKTAAITIRRNCRLVECVDADQARAYAANLPGARRIGDRFLLCEGEAEVRQSLDTVIAYNGHDTKCLEQEEGLRLRAPWQQTDLLLWPKLEAYGEVVRHSNGDWLLRLNPKTIQQDGDWSVLLTELETLTKEPLAARYRAALRAWCGDGAAAHTRTAPLVRFSDVEVCQAALEMPGAEDCVEGRLGRYTLILRQGKLAAFKKRMREYGIPVTAAKGGWSDSEADLNGCSLEEHEAHGNEPEARPAARTKTTKTRRTHASKTAQANGNGNGDGESLPSYSPRITREIIEEAIRKRRPLLIAYQSTWSPQPTVRRVNPVSLDLVGPAPTLNGYCHHHEGSRSFKLTQVRGIRILEDESF